MPNSTILVNLKEKHAQCVEHAFSFKKVRNQSYFDLAKASSGYFAGRPVFL